MQTDLPETAWGAAIAGRLKGPVFQSIMSMRATRYENPSGKPRVMEAPELFAEPAVAELQHSFGGPQIVQPAQASGAQLLVAHVFA